MSETTTAISLMRMALALLDRADASSAACHLQAAIDTAEGVAPMVEGDQITDEEEERVLGPLPIEAATVLLPR
jgi:hypothetical protein